jgi:DNA-binding transcriptional ArsR family regulator
MRVTALAAHFDMSLNSVSKHIKVLEEAGLVTRRTLGREHFIAAELEPLKVTEDWFGQLKSIWDLRLAALDNLLVSQEEDMSELELTVSRKIAASREKVFKAWLSPATLAKFMRTAADGIEASKVETDPVKGGRFTIVMVTPEREIPHTGTYLEINPYSRLSFTWESPHSLDDSVAAERHRDVQLVAQDLEALRDALPRPSRPGRRGTGGRSSCRGRRAPRP